MCDIVLISTLTVEMPTAECPASASARMLMKEALVSNCTVSCGDISPSCTEELAVRGFWNHIRMVRMGVVHQIAVPGCRERGGKTSMVS